MSIPKSTLRRRRRAGESHAAFRNHPVGWPASVGERTLPRWTRGFLDLGVPVLGICYGMQLLAFNLGGWNSPKPASMAPPTCGSFVPAPCGTVILTKLSRVWMSHGDTVKTPPAGSSLPAAPTRSKSGHGRRGPQDLRRAVPPEVHHSVDGDTMLRNFLFKIARSPRTDLSSFVERVINEVRETVGDGHGLRSPAVWIPPWSPCCCTRPSARTCTASL